MRHMTDNSFELFISDVPLHKKFYCHDGSAFKNLGELEQAFKKMSPETFSYHANSEKNDFANWIYDVIGDITLSDSLRDVLDSKAAAKKLRARITFIQKKIKNSSRKV